MKFLKTISHLAIYVSIFFGTHQANSMLKGQFEYDIFKTIKKYRYNPSGFIKSLNKLQENAGLEPFTQTLKACLTKKNISLCDIKNPWSENEKSILHKACQKRDYDGITIILEAADEYLWKLLKMQDRNGLTALHVAGFYNDKRMVTMLLAASNKCDKTAKFIAMETYSTQRDIALELCEEHDNPNPKIIKMLQLSDQQPADR